MPVSATGGFTFAGFTAATTDGNMGGIVGANGKCHAEFPGSHLCTRREFDWVGTSQATGASGAWVDDVYYPTGSYPGYTPRDRGGVYDCSNWKANDTAAPGLFVDSFGHVSSSNGNICQLKKQVACCRAPSDGWFRGYTVATTDGNMGGIVGAHGKCNAEFAGSHLCTRRELDFAGTAQATGAAGAWVDDVYYPTGSYPGYTPRDRGGVYDCSDWKANDTASPGLTVDSFGDVVSSNGNICNLKKQVACCGG